MVAACAACRQPINGRDDYVLSGTEVLHRVCAAQGARTITWRLRLAVAKLKARVAELEYERDHERAMAAAARVEINAEEARAAEERRRRELIQRDRDHLAERVHTLEDNARLVADEQVRAAGFRRALESQLAQAQNELRLYRALGPAPASASPEVAAVNATPSDGTAERFRLLELDLEKVDPSE
jgi:hypothetical protein